MALSPLIHFRTSTWTYEGWCGLVYTRTYPKGRFKQDCLREYAEYVYRGERVFRTVGFDFTFYGPPSVRQLSHYASLLPTEFKVCAKVWQDITVPAFGTGTRRKELPGPNPHFLDVDYFNEQFLLPFEEAFSEHTGPFIFEFQRTAIEPADFLRRLDCFLSKLPTKHEYAVEVRNPRLLGSRYRDILGTHGIAHVYNHLTSLPSLAEQHERLGENFTASFVVCRLLTPRDRAMETR